VRGACGSCMSEVSCSEEMSARPSFCSMSCLLPSLGVSLSALFGLSSYQPNKAYALFPAANPKYRASKDTNVLFTLANMYASQWRG